MSNVYLRAAFALIPFMIIGRYHYLDLSVPEDARLGLPRIFGIPVTFLTWGSWTAIPLVTSRRFRELIFRPLSLGLLAVIAAFAMLGVLRGNGVRNVFLDVQLWLGLWAGFGLAFTVCDAGKGSWWIHLAMTAWCFFAALYALLARAAAGLSIGVDRVLDPIAFHYMGLLIVLAGCCMRWRSQKPLASTVITMFGSAALTAVSAFVVLGRAFTITFGAVLLTALVLEWRIRTVAARGRQKQMGIMWIRAGFCSIIVLLALGVWRFREKAAVTYRFRDDSYTYTENSRLIEVSETFGAMTGRDNVVGWGLGSTTGRTSGEGGLGLHIGILTLVMKFGWIVACVMWLYILYQFSHSLKRALFARIDLAALNPKMMTFPAVVGLLVVACLSGGYYDYTYASIGYIVGLICCSNGQAQLSNRRTRSGECHR